MRKKKNGKVVMAAAAAALMLSLQTSALAANDVLKVGVRETVVGFGYKNTIAGTYAGMEIDLARKLAEELNYSDVEFVSVTPQTREQALENGEVDCVIATFSITEERKEKVSFSEPYFVDGTRVLAEKSTLFEKPEDLEGAIVAVAQGSTAADALKEELKGTVKTISFQEYENYPAMATALESGKADAMCGDGCILNGYLNDERRMLDMSFAPQEYGVASIKDSELSEKISLLISEWNEDGTIAQLIEKWDLQ